MNNLLIGGSGFIGSALGEELIKRGEQVVSVSLDGKGDAAGVESVTLDLYRQNCPQKLIDWADNVFVLAIGQIRGGFDAKKERQVVTNLASSLRDSRCRVFFFSSVAVYGETPKKATEQTKCKPLGDYGKFKLKAEGIFKKQISDDRLVIFRLANIYGSPKNKGFIGLLMDKLSQPDPKIIINGNGEQRRDYVFIDDLVGAIIKIAQKKDRLGIVNISTGQSHSLIDVIKLISKISGKTIDYEITRKMLDEPNDSFIDNSLLSKVFGYKKFTPLKAGLAKTLKRYQDINS